MFLMTTAFVAMLGTFSAINISVGQSSDEAQLTTTARTVADVIESESFAYVQCAGPTGQAPTGSTPYQTAIRAAVATTYTIRIVAVAQATGGSHTVSGNASQLSPINGCSHTGYAVGPDFGVQQIEFQVASTRHSLERIVYKRWN
jgi:hypothetical protein